jgi:hypothetical protein
MVRFCERVGWSGGKLDLVWTFLVCIDDSAWFLKALSCCSRLFLVVILGALSWWFSRCVFRTLLLGIWWGNSCEPFVVLLPLIPLPNPWVKGLDFWSFRCSRVRGVLGGISSIPLDLTSFGGQNHGYGLLMRCSYHPPKSCSSPWSDSGDRSLDLEELTRRCCSSRAAQATPVKPMLLTGLTGASHLWDLPWVNCLTRVSFGLGAAGQFLVCLGLVCQVLCRAFLLCRLCFGGVFVPGPRDVTEAFWNACCAAAVATGLTGSAHRSDQCSTGNKPCKFGCVDLANLGSESETCIGSRVRLVGVSVSFEKNFYWLPFTPPSLVRRIVLQ